MTMPGATRKRLPRPSAGVTADRLADALTRWPSRFTPAEKESAGVLIARLNEIAEDNNR